MTADDLDAVAAIESRSQAFPWSRAAFADSLAAGHEAWVVEADAQPVGFTVTMLVVDEVHLLNIAVAREFQRQGWGNAILRCLLERAKAAAATRMLLEVRASNAPALGLYRKLGFVTIGQRRNYYSAPGNAKEDAIVMAKDL